MGRGGNQQLITSGTTRSELTPADSYEQFKKDKLNILYLDTDQKVKDVAKIIRQLDPTVMALDLETASKTAGFGPGKGAFNGSIRTIQIGLDEPERGIQPIQILIDCHQASPRPFVPFLRSRKIEKQIHFLDYEQSWSEAQLGTSIGNIYDTCIAHSEIQKKLATLDEEERELIWPGYEKHSNRLDTLTENYLQMELPKDNQASDWGKQRLSRDQLIYAAMDVAILPDLTKQIKKVADKLEIAEDIDWRIRDRKAKVSAQIEKAKQTNSDDSKRLIKALGRCKTRDELKRCFEYGKQMAILAENSEEVLQVYRERRADLLT